MKKTIWIPKSEIEDGEVVYLPDYAGITRSQARSKLYHSFMTDDSLHVDTVQEGLEKLGWDLVEVALTEVREAEE